MKEQHRGELELSKVELNEKVEDTQRRMERSQDARLSAEREASPDLRQY